MIRLWLMTVKEAAAFPEERCRELFPARMERAQKFRFKEDRLRCIGAGILMHEILGIKENELKTGAQGKPCTKDMEFNLSHSGQYILLAAANQPVGVDIEKLDERHLSVAKRVFVPQELSWMEKVPEERTDRFFRLWTLKEAVMKALGKGLSLPPESFCVLPFFDGKPVIVEGCSLYGVSALLPGYAVGLCSTEKIEKMPEISRKSTDMETD